jgi:uncharacterized membrane protein YkgB
MNTLANATLNPFVGILRRSGLLAEDLDYHVIPASMVIIFLFFGYQKWFEYEAQVQRSADLVDVSRVRHPRRELVLGRRRMDVRCAPIRRLLGQAAEHSWRRRCARAFVMTVTIIPFMPNGWAASAGGFPAMTGNIPFLMKDVVLLAASIYLLKQDVKRIGQR